MSETGLPTVVATPSPLPKRRRRWLWNLLGLSIAFAAVFAAFCFWASTEEFANLVRGRLVAQLQTATGGRVEIRSFHWKFFDLEAEADGIVIHGTEDAGEEPYAQLDKMRARISILGVLSPRVLLRDLEVSRPQVHLVFYPNGTTNQPHPRNQRPSNKPVLDTLFDLKAGHIAVEQGLLHFDNRAASFDSQNRYLPLDFAANDASLLMKYVPPQGRDPESYHIESGVRDLTLQRGGATPAAPPAVHGYVQATLDLVRNAAYLRSLRVTASTRGVKDRSLELTGALFDFSHPRWNVKAIGDLDLHLLSPVVGYPFAPEGVAHLNIDGSGQAGQFDLDGPVHVDGGAYVAPGINARDLQLDTRAHADGNVMHFSDIVVRFKQGGQMEGDLLLQHWLPHPPVHIQVRAAESPAQAPKPRQFWNRHKAPPAPPPPPQSARLVLVKDPETEITVNGTIQAKFKDVAVDTVLDIVGQRPFKRIGVDARLNGPALCRWFNGEVNTLNVTSTLTMSPSLRPVANEAPGSGVIEGTYTQRDGAVDLRRLELNLRGSQMEAHGHLGAYPLTSPTNMSVDLRTHDLGEFDTVLRALGLEHNGKAGTEALPVSLGGQGEFHGTWAGSLMSPRLSGNLNATDVAIEMPSPANDKTGVPQFVRWDSVRAQGSYSADRISILHGEMRRGQSEIVADGTLSAPNGPAPLAGSKTVTRGAEMPAFDNGSVLRAQVRASKVAVSDVLPVVGVQAPVSGIFDAQFDTDGPVRALAVTGWVELSNALVYGEPVSHARAQGSFANQSVKLASITANAPAGSIAGSGSYDMKSRQFSAEAHAADIDVAKIEKLRSANQALGGRLGFTATASGTLDDPKIEGHARVAGVSVGAEQLGALELTAHTVNHDLEYDASAHADAAQLALHGRTGLRGDYPTEAKVDFSRMNIGAILRMAHVSGITAESALEGTASVHGPMAHPDQLQGQASIQQMAVTVAGVHLQSDGAVHATLTNARVSLDPVHITGDQTDLHAHGSLGLKDTQPLDFQAGGSVNLKLAETLDPDLTAGGTTTFQVEAHGSLANPGLRGRIDFENGSLSLEDLPNGLSQLHGTLEFNQNRLEVRSLTAMTGGGQLSVGGYLAYQHGLYADLSVSGKSIRIRYPQGVSSLADATLHLQGTQPNLLLSGNVLLTRFSVSADLDIAALAAQANAVQPIVPPDAPSNHIRLDVRVQSSPQLNFQNAYAKLAGDVDLRLRGTLATPSLLGRISITEGNAIIAGTRYELQRGDIQFTNPVRIQPSIDINATARVEDYDITLGLHGTPDKLSVTYRSDPPLPESDVVALLALGRTQSEQGLYTQQQEQSAGLNGSTDVLLGGALNATVSSRVQKLFGAGSVKVDPNYLGALGNSTTRITVDEQLGKNVTLTYATNVDTSAQQLLQAEIAINRHVSLLVARDESGVFSMVLKATRRYR